MNMRQAGDNPLSEAESEIYERFKRENLRPIRWENGPDAVYGEHSHAYGKVLVVASGSITLSVNDGERVMTMKGGDRLELSPGTSHSAIVGAEGVVCFEAHVPASRWDKRRRQ